MDEVSKTELRGRLIFLFRLLKVDTVISYDPWGHYEENPDHYITAQAVEAACWMSAGKLDWPEHKEVGLEPHGVSEKFYFARGPQLVNRVVDIGPFLQQKVAMIESCETMILHMLKDVNASLAKRRLTLPAFAGPDGPGGEGVCKRGSVHCAARPWSGGEVQVGVCGGVPPHRAGSGDGGLHCQECTAFVADYFLASQRR